MGLVLHHIKTDLYFVVLKGFVLCHNKKALFYVILKGKYSVIYFTIKFTSLERRKHTVNNLEQGKAHC